MTADEFRILALHRIIDEMGGVDLHARSSELAGGGEPTDASYLAATREALDQIVKEEFGEVKPADVPRLATYEPTPQEIEALMKLPHGPIQVVYPLDEEWNAAIEAAAAKADEFNDPEKVSNIVAAIRDLKRDNSPEPSK